jgi:hypothetical protein
MTSDRPRRPVLLALALLTTLVASCSEEPDAPRHDNPFDPTNPGAADPFGLEAVFSGDRVVLTWTQLEGFAIATYEVQKSTDALNFSAIGDTTAGTGEMQYVVRDVTPTVTNYFRIRAIDENGLAPRMSHVVPASVSVGPLLAVEGSLPARTRIVDVTAGAGTADTVELSRDVFFEEPLIAEVVDSVATFPDLDLGPAASADTVFTLYARAVTELGEGLPPAYSSVSSLDVAIGLDPGITLVGGGGTVAGPAVDLVVADAVGVARLRFAAAAEDLPDAPWQEAADTLRAIPVQDTVAEQMLFGEFETVFGYTTVDQLTLQADDLSAGDFALDLPGNRISATRELTLLHDAVAAEMRVSQDPGFTGAAWVAYADTSEIVLEGERGLYNGYVQYRNHWFQSPIRSDFVILSGAELQVAFTNPTGGQPVRGGTTIEVTGTAETFDADYAITAVRVHLGDGWIEATGAENWEAVWEVPLLTADTSWPLGAEVTATNAEGDEQTGLAWIDVTITQLAVTIDTPAESAELTRGTEVSIAGTAAADLTGAPLDSVVVTALGDRLPVTGNLANWSVSWLVPAGDDTQPTTLQAHAYAGGDSVLATVPVVLVRPAPEEER